MMAKEKKKEEMAEAPSADDLLKEAAKETEKWKNEYYRVYADMENLRKQLERDHTEAIKYRASGFVEELLPALDSFRFALNAEPQSDEARNYKTGFDYIYKLILSALEKEGVQEKTPPLGSAFDATYMQALDAVEEDGEPNKVTKVYAAAYYLKDRLIRPARVQVRINKEENQEPAADEASAA